MRNSAGIFAKINLVQMRLLLFLSLLFYSLPIMAQKNTMSTKPLRVAIVGLVHTHVHWILGREKKGDIEIVGIAEPDRELAGKYAQQHGYSMELVYDSMEEMINATKPEAVLAFNTIYDHLKVVEYCAPRGIHVMVEKPLAVSMEHADKMLKLAKRFDIHLLTNYETTWYGSNKKAYDIVNKEEKQGEIRKIVFHTGHQGPVEIGCNKEFLDWLTDPVLNGGGALTDFGCYGANMATWLMKGEKPETVSAITQQIKPHLYPKVEDEATIILKYKKAQVIIQASWNWPYSRKDMEVYGVTGYVFCKDRTNMLVKESEKAEPHAVMAGDLPADRNDPFIYFANVIRGKIKMETYDLSAPANNEIVMKILEAAKESAKSGKAINWKEYFKE
ncbi:MAG: Gfo/Idh/MocA family oxidoreductase [Chitinophagaceae bacterium]|nr:Gfo/Idh/MocA family oxidoreductase [Chitinophagaceae bacterium]